MRERCHRCHLELPATPVAAGREAVRGSQSDEDVLLFCPHCGAPQICFPEHLREVEAEASTGTEPPPRLATGTELDWRRMIEAGLVVAGISGVLTMLSFAFQLLGLPSLLWTAGGAVVAIGLYSRSRPQTVWDVRTGVRSGVVTGVLLVAATLIALAVTGLVARFALHRMGAFDAQMNEQLGLMQARLAERLAAEPSTREIGASVVAFTHTQEFRAGFGLTNLAVISAMILAVSAGGGAFAGLLRAGRRRP